MHRKIAALLFTFQTFLSFAFPALLLLVFLSGCGGHAGKPELVHQTADSIPASPPPSASTNQSVKGAFSDQRILHFDSTILAGFSKRFPQFKKYNADLTRFYGLRNFRYAWYEPSGLIEQANNLYTHLLNLHHEGIQEKPPYISDLDSLLNDPLVTTNPDPFLEILLTAEYLFYADKVWIGIPESQTTRLQWFIPRKKLNLPYLIDSLISDTSARLFSDNYSFRQYDLLKDALKKYRYLDSLKNWNPIGGKNSSFKLHDSSGEIMAIRQRLYQLGDLSASGASAVFDTTLENAVKSFQLRYGLAPNGKADAVFLRKINAPLDELIRKIVINMERARWVPLDLRNHYLIINIPSFSLYAYDNDTLNFTMNVVVGKDVHKTVLFSGDIKYVVFSPYWDIPPSILKNEILPGIKRDPNYLRRNNMEWVGDRVRQKPGPKNSLGLVKFLFPNSYNIYLHDTPVKGLFERPARAFSHGCIRLGEPEKLANYLLMSDTLWTGEKINQAMHAGKEKYVTLKNPVPVYIGYMTVFVDSKGKINFREDVYSRDRALEDMLLR